MSKQTLLDIYEGNKYYAGFGWKSQKGTKLQRLSKIIKNNSKFRRPDDNDYSFLFGLLGDRRDLKKEDFRALRYHMHRRHLKGLECGHLNGLKSGKKIGYNEGYDIGHKDGYDLGYDIGFGAGSGDLSINDLICLSQD